ncbi:hypothetical protein NEOLEDRAFT_1077109 [Neolentinus lepideus HHB14362 ss-1]|uniref:Fungal-type protein kinase domain-containing protein n=1 Tax=Neolentinus lepideus HHB14362 ss-1 TaxID=1314782 RepID=A0A165NM29_9AGAM|nr:hypothetical protein NEOLEDRAFT_1077109 [Neolentinus lepideus HHB14362 ss-1]
MHWPPKVICQFKKVPVNPSKAHFHGPYNKLLSTLFPPDTNFTIVPHYMPLPAGLISAGFIVCLCISPVFILELKSPGDLRYTSSCQATDRQLCACIRDVHIDCPLPVLYAISMMGTRLCFYKRPHDGCMEPPFIAANPELEMDMVP